MKKNILTTAGSIVTALFASLCCIGPAMLALVGAGSFGAFAAIEKYRLYFIGLTIIMLGLAFFFTYRKREVHCEDGSCKIEGAGRWNKIGVWSAAFIAVLALSYPNLAVKPAPVTNAAFAPKAAVILNIEGMTCNGCATGIQDALSGLTGVHSVSVGYESKKAHIAYDSTLVTPEALIKRVNKAGYNAAPSQDKKRKYNEFVLPATFEPACC